MKQLTSVDVGRTFEYSLCSFLIRQIRNTMNENTNHITIPTDAIDILDDGINRVATKTEGRITTTYIQTGKSEARIVGKCVVSDVSVRCN